MRTELRLSTVQCSSGSVGARPSQTRISSCRRIRTLISITAVSRQCSARGCVAQLLRSHKAALLSSARPKNSNTKHKPRRLMNEIICLASFQHDLTTSVFIPAGTRSQLHRDKAYPRFRISAAVWDVLLPGAEQQSMTLLPGVGLNTSAGMQLACNQKNSRPIKRN